MSQRYTRKKRKNKGHKQLVYMGGNHERCLFIDMMHNEGLGNQLFILATGFVARNKTGLPLCIVLSKYSPHSQNIYQNLFQFPPDIRVMTEIEARPRIEAGERILEIGDHHASAKWTNNNIKHNSSSKKNATVPGRLYQNYSAIKTVIPDVKKLLVANEFSKKATYRNLENATPPDSAFIHIRRGDYVKHGWDLKDDYFLRGIDLLDKDSNVKIIWIISNDLKWCKSVSWKTHTQKPIKYYNSKNELEVLYKMSLCTAGAVISPSTFSAWGVMLGADMNPTSTIVYPVSWLTHDGDSNNNPLDFPSRWKGIPNSV